MTNPTDLVQFIGPAIGGMGGVAAGLFSWATNRAGRIREIEFKSQTADFQTALAESQKSLVASQTTVLNNALAYAAAAAAALVASEERLKARIVEEDIRIAEAVGRERELCRRRRAELEAEVSECKRQMDVLKGVIANLEAEKARAIEQLAQATTTETKEVHHEVITTTTQSAPSVILPASHTPAD